MPLQLNVMIFISNVLPQLIAILLPIIDIFTFFTKRCYFIWQLCYYTHRYQGAQRRTQQDRNTNIDFCPIKESLNERTDHQRTSRTSNRSHRYCVNRSACADSPGN